VAVKNDEPRHTSELCLRFNKSKGFAWAKASAADKAKDLVEALLKQLVTYLNSEKVGNGAQLMASLQSWDGAWVV
jgi:hypothetical protein